MFGGDQITALVFDIGRCKTRIGWAGEDAPSHVYDTTEMDHAFELLNVESSEHPLMLAEPSWNPKEEREKMVQLCFERFNTPGLYLGRSAVLSAFAAGKSTALVLDSGYSSSVVPVFEGYIVKKAIEQSALGGNFISEQVLAFLSKQNIDLTPSHLIKEKRAVETNAPPKFVKKDLPLKNQHLLIHDFKETVLNVSETTFDGASLAKRPLKKYEFPTGYNTVFGVDRFSLVECLFNSDYITKPLDPLPMTIPQMLKSSISKCDIDLQPQFESSVVLTGANTLLHGFADRVYMEMHHATAGARIKIHAAGGSTERKFGPWIGGSILASLDNFAPLWISKEQYDEEGVRVESKIY